MYRMCQSGVSAPDLAFDAVADVVLTDDMCDSEQSEYGVVAGLVCHHDRRGSFGRLGEFR